MAAAPPKSSAQLRVLIVGGGFSGLSAGIALARDGHAVELVEIASDWTTYGAGISIGGATLRALRQLGVLECFLAEGYAGDGTEIRTPAGDRLAMLPTPRMAGPDVPGNAAVMRPVLARLLTDAALAAGIVAKLGTSFTRIDPEVDGVAVAFDDGRAARYDLVVGADGLRSAVRTALWPDAPEPACNGQGVWRAVLPRPAGIDHTILWVGVGVKVGVNPVSADAMYLFVNENRPGNDRVVPGEYLERLRELLAAFPAPEVQAMRAALDDGAQIVFRPIEAMLLPRPWHKGRVVLIGDAVHATTPHLASGAGIGIEDAIVLAEEIARHADLAAALATFEERRWPRCRMVVENSGRLGAIETGGGSKAEHAELMRQSFLALAEPI